jgi:helix-turn-helix protein
MRDGPGPSIVGGANSSEPGWLGLEILQHTVDWKLCGQLGDGTVRVRVDPGSPANKTGIKTGDYVISINGMGLGEFQAGGLRAGTKAIIKVHRDGQVLFAEVTIRPRPKPKHQNKLSVSCAVVVPCGADVGRKERLKWIARVTGDPALSLIDKLVAIRLLVRYANRITGIAYPGIETLAADLGVSRRAATYAVSRLHRAGYYDIKSGKSKGRSNEYTATWPAPNANVLRLPRRGEN